MTDSCLVAKLSHYMRFTKTEESLLAALEEEETAHGKGDVIYRAGDRPGVLYVVKAGWLTASTDLPDGRRQVVRILQPGDIVGFPDIVAERAQTDLRAVEAGRLCPFPRHKLSRVFHESARLTALIFAVSQRDQLVAMDVLRAVSRMSARERVAHLLCDLAARAKAMDRFRDDVLRLPLQQQDIGDHLGLTNVYVSKTITALVSEGPISRVEGGLRLRDLPALERIADYVDRHAEIATDWFPGPADEKDGQP